MCPAQGRSPAQGRHPRSGHRGHPRCTTALSGRHCSGAPAFTNTLNPRGGREGSRAALESNTTRLCSPSTRAPCKSSLLGGATLFSPCPAPHVPPGSHVPPCCAPCGSLRPTWHRLSQLQAACGAGWMWIDLQLAALCSSREAGLERFSPGSEQAHPVLGRVRANTAVWAVQVPAEGLGACQALSAHIPPPHQWRRVWRTEEFPQANGAQENPAPMGARHPRLVGGQYLAATQGWDGAPTPVLASPVQAAGEHSAGRSLRCWARGCSSPGCGDGAEGSARPFLPAPSCGRQGRGYSREQQRDLPSPVLPSSSRIQERAVGMQPVPEVPERLLVMCSQARPAPVTTTALGWRKVTARCSQDSPSPAP